MGARRPAERVARRGRISENLAGTITMTETTWQALRHLDDTTAWVVGGTVRDWALGRTPKDLDLAVSGDLAAAGRAIAEATNGHYFVLHPATQTARVAIPDGTWVDLVALPDTVEPVPLRLKADLCRRDFTINAMAAPLPDFVGALSTGHFPDLAAEPPAFLRDPTGGWGDLRHRVLRMTHPQAFAEDALRPLRGLRLSFTLGFSPGGEPFVPEPETARAMRACAPRLAEVSAERARDEWLLMMDTPYAVFATVRAADLGFLNVILPEWREMAGVTQNPYHHLDVWGHTLDVLLQFDAIQSPDALEEPLRLPQDLRAPVMDYLSECLTPPHTRRALVHMAILLHDAGKPATRTEEEGRVRFFGHEHTSQETARAWAQRWRLSGREREFLLSIVGLHMRPGGLVAPGVTTRAIQRFFRDAGSAAPALLLLNAADRLAARGPWTTEQEVREQVEGSWRLLRTWQAMKETVALPLPISGRDVMAAFNLEPGPQVGRIIQTLRDLHAETPFSDREAALEVAREWLHEMG